MALFKATVMALLALCLLVTNTSAVSYGCCQGYMRTKIPFKSIKGYSVQTMNETCHINAIIFHTTRGRLCTNPALGWVMDYINRIRNKAQMVHMKTSRAQK